MEVIILNKEQAEQLQGKPYSKGILFNCVPIDENTYYISKQVQERCSVAWLKELPVSNYEPPEIEDHE